MVRRNFLYNRCLRLSSEEILCTKVASWERKFYVQKIIDGEDEDEEGKRMIYAVFMNPFLRVRTPSTLLSRCAPLSLISIKLFSIF